MNLFKSKLMNRIALWKVIGLIMWGLIFFMLPVIFTNPDIMLRFAVLLWYIILWATIWVYGILTKIPVFDIKFPACLRWMWIGGWMNFVLALFMYNSLTTLMVWSILEWYSPFWIVLEWAVFWLILDLIATKFIWEWKELVKTKKM